MLGREHSIIKREGEMITLRVTVNNYPRHMRPGVGFRVDFLALLIHSTVCTGNIDFTHTGLVPVGWLQPR